MILYFGRKIYDISKKKIDILKPSSVLYLFDFDTKFLYNIHGWTNIKTNDNKDAGYHQHCSVSTLTEWLMNGKRREARNSLCR
jgi:hypothetical protein